MAGPQLANNAAVLSGGHEVARPVVVDVPVVHQPDGDNHSDRHKALRFPTDKANKGLSFADRLNALRQGGRPTSTQQAQGAQPIVSQPPVARTVIQDRELQYLEGVVSHANSGVTYSSVQLKAALDDKGLLGILATFDFAKDHGRYNRAMNALGALVNLSLRATKGLPFQSARLIPYLAAYDRRYGTHFLVQTLERARSVVDGKLTTDHYSNADQLLKQTAQMLREAPGLLMGDDFDRVSNVLLFGY